MSKGRATSRAPAPASSRFAARVLGIVSLAAFFIPLIAPFLQVFTLVYVLHAAWRGTLDRQSVIIGACGAALGFVLYLATELIWIV